MEIKFTQKEENVIYECYVKATIDGGISLGQKEELKENFDSKLPYSPDEKDYAISKLIKALIIRYDAEQSLKRKAVK